MVMRFKSDYISWGKTLVVENYASKTSPMATFEKVQTIPLEYENEVAGCLLPSTNNYEYETVQAF